MCKIVHDSQLPALSISMYVEQCEGMGGGSDAGEGPTVTVCD